MLTLNWLGKEKRSRTGLLLLCAGRAITEKNTLQMLLSGSPPLLLQDFNSTSSRLLHRTDFKGVYRWFWSFLEKDHTGILPTPEEQNTSSIRVQKWIRDNKTSKQLDYYVNSQECHRRDSQHEVRTRAVLWGLVALNLLWLPNGLLRRTIHSDYNGKKDFYVTRNKCYKINAKIHNGKVCFFLIHCNLLHWTITQG